MTNNPYFAEWGLPDERRYGGATILNGMGPVGADILADYAILDTPGEESFDDIVLIAAQACGTPVALITLLDHHRQWFKARIGFALPETPIDESVCRLTTEDGGLLVIPDMSRDPRTDANPQVTGDGGGRFYAGAPLMTEDGVMLGRLCVVDPVPRPDGLDPVQAATLLALARQVMRLLEQRRTARLAGQLAALQTCLIAVGELIRRSATVEEMTTGTAAIVGSTLAADRAGYGTVDTDTEMVSIAPDWTAPGMASIAGDHRFADFGTIRDELSVGDPLVIDDVETDPRTCADAKPMRALAIGALVNMPVRERGRTIAIFIVQSRVARTWTVPELAFLRAVADRLEAGVARFRSERQQEMLNQEISHRLKNMLAMVQAIATQTLRSVVDRAPIDMFEQRLVALGTAHDVLMQGDWAGAELGGIIHAVCRAFGYTDRVSCDGPAVTLGPRAAMSFSLLVHELLTNAMKYGALSNDAGGVSILWDMATVDGAAGVIVRWRETGGPPVLPPERRGFGSRLIRMGLAGTGGVTLRYDKSGFEADMSATLVHLSDA